MGTASQLHSNLRGCSLAWLLVLAAAVAPAAAAEPSWKISPDGASVVNSRDKLAWDRCVHGQRWNGKTCEGEVKLLSHGDGLALASERGRSGGMHCRLPTLVELKALAAQIAVAGKTPPLFPPVSTGWRWSGTRIVDTATINQYNYGNVMQGRNNENAVRIDVQHVWAVDVASGDARKDVSKRSRLPVQLVCY